MTSDLALAQTDLMADRTGAASDFIFATSQKTGSAGAGIRPCKLATIEVRHAELLGHIAPVLMWQLAKTVRKYLGFR